MADDPRAKLIPVPHAKIAWAFERTVDNDPEVQRRPGEEPDDGWVGASELDAALAESDRYTPSERERLQKMKKTAGVAAGERAEPLRGRRATAKANDAIARMQAYLRARVSAPADSLAGKQRAVMTAVAQEIDQTITSQLAGVHMNLAAATDTPDGDHTHESHVQGRSWSTDPLAAAALHGTDLATHRARNIMLVSKHFPGLGGAFVDSHFTSPVIDKTVEEMEKRELIPFRWAIHNGARVIMTGHATYPRLSPAEPTAPATFSREIVTDLLRKRLGFDGLVMTDELFTMNSAKKYEPDVPKRLAKAIKAGNDILLVFVLPKGLKERLRSIVADLAAEAGRDPELRRRIDESALRVLREKHRVFGDALFTATKGVAWPTWLGGTEPADPVAALLAKLSLEERIGQLIMHDGGTFLEHNTDISVTRELGLGGQYIRSQAPAAVVERLRKEGGFKVPPFLAAEVQGVEEYRQSIGWTYTTGGKHRPPKR
jgi:beta-glucosidase-like glycosyl hydrolase